MSKQKLEDLRNPADEWIDGAVQVSDWSRVPWETRVVTGFVGKVRVVAAEAATGFKIEGGGHANWVALVRGPSGTIHVIPGCRVVSITYDTPVNNGEFSEVP